MSHFAVVALSVNQPLSMTRGVVVQVSVSQLLVHGTCPRVRKCRPTIIHGMCHHESKCESAIMYKLGVVVYVNMN